jgi:hypothetical protein
MPKYIVRPKIGQHDKQFSGAEGASGTVIYTETAAKAREQGAAKLKRRPDEVEVIEQEDTTFLFGQDEPLTKEEAAEIWNQDTQVAGGWQPL